MRKASLFVLIIFCQTLMAVDINKRTVSAVEYINKGYIRYGCEELRKAAAVNDLAAQFYVAICYEHGIGFEKDVAQAFKMYRKAAERGLPDAMFNISTFYRRGIVVSQDTSKEQEWLQRYRQKGGKLVLPDLFQIYNEGLKHPENYALNPNGSNNNQSNLLVQNNGNTNSQKQTINNITIVQQTPAQNGNLNSQESNKSIVPKNKSDVDMDIPVTQLKQNNTFVLIIANENYLEVSKVSNAINDGIIFGEYCKKTLGIPQSNIKILTDGTFNIIKRQLNWISQVMDAFQGEATVIFYYAGHGIPNESNGLAYLLPVDGYSNDVSTGCSLENIYEEIGSKPAKCVLVFIDACFSGANRGDGMLTATRGVAIKAKQNAPKGNMLVMSAAQGDETAYPYEEKEHGMFTYFLLKKLKETKGNVTMGELTDYITTEVKRRSIIINGKLQTPTVTPSVSLLDSWRNLKLR